jgi:hypothetical protein
LKDVKIKLREKEFVHDETNFEELDDSSDIDVDNPLFTEEINGCGYDVQVERIK